jgi:thioesterase domain-containing protein
MTLYEINTKYLALLDAIANDEIPEEAIADTLEAVQAEFNDKAEAIGLYIKNLSAEAEAIKAEVDALLERLRAKNNKVESLKNYLLSAMQASGKAKIETARIRLSVANNPPSVDIEDEGLFADWAKENKPELLIPQPPKISRQDIKNLLNSGTSIPYCALKVKQSLRIK